MFRPLTTIFLATLCLHLPAAQGESVPEEKTDVIPISKIPDIPPAKPGQFDRAFRRGVDFLLKTQNKDGSWGDPPGNRHLEHPLPLPGRAPHLQNSQHRPVHCRAQRQSPAS